MYKSELKLATTVHEELPNKLNLNESLDLAELLSIDIGENIYNINYVCFNSNKPQ